MRERRASGGLERDSAQPAGHAPALSLPDREESVPEKIPFQYRAEKKPAVRCDPGGAFGLPGQRKERGGRDPGKGAGGGAERISESAGQPGPDPVRAEILVLPFHPGNRRKFAHDPECGQSAAAPAPGKTEAISGSEGNIWKGIRKKRNARRMPERAAGKESG